VIYKRFGMRSAQWYLLALTLLAVGSIRLATAAEFEIDDGLRWTGRDDAWRVEINGRIHLDSASYSADLTPLASGTEVRRLRPRVDLRFGENWRARLDYELGDVGQGIKNGWLEYRGFDRWRIRVGNQLAPFGLEQQMSSNALPLLERSLLQALTPGFESGASANYRGDRWQFKAGIFDGDISSNDARRADGSARTARITFAPLNGEKLTWHVGASLESRRNLSNDRLRFSTRPESYVDGQRLVDTGTLSGVDRLGTTGLETALVFRRCRIVAERVANRIDFGLAQTAELEGSYASFGCLVAGEAYRYQPATGGFRSIRASGRLGVMEVTLRRSRVSLSDAGIAGGIQENWTLGANWQPTDHIRILADYVSMDLVPNENGDSESPDVVQVRFQLAF